MKPSPFQPLSEVYQSLKAVLYETVLCQYTTDFTLPHSYLSIKKTEDTLSLFEQQTAMEEAVLFSAVHDYEPIVVAILRDDHSARAKSIRQMRDIVSQLKNADETYLKILYSSRLLRQFNEFMAACISQMKSHEAMLTPVLQKYYSEEELVQISASISLVKSSVSTGIFRKENKKAVAFF